MVKLTKKRTDLITETKKRQRKATFEPKQVEADSLKVSLIKPILKSTHLNAEAPDKKSLYQIWNDYCQTHEAYQFLRKKNSDKYGDAMPPPSYCG